MSRSRSIGILKVAVAAGLVWWVVHRTGWETIQRTLSTIDLRGWLLGLGVLFAAFIATTLRWHLLMQSVGLHTTPWLAVRLGFIGLFFNNLLPGLSGGDLVKAVYVSRENPRRRARAVVSVIVDRAVGIVALALIAAVVIPFDLETYGEVAVGTYGFLLAAGLGAVLALSRRTKARLRRVLARLGRKPGGGTGLLGKIDEAVSMYRHRLGLLFGALLLSVAAHLGMFVALSLFGDALADGGLASLGELPVEMRTSREAELEALGDLGLEVYCSVVPVILIVSALPIAPAGWGVGEAAFAYFFQAASVAQADSVALSLTYRVTVMLISLLGGAVLLFDRKRVMEATAAERQGPP